MKPAHPVMAGLSGIHVLLAATLKDWMPGQAGIGLSCEQAPTPAPRSSANIYRETALTFAVGVRAVRLESRYLGAFDGDRC